MPSPKRGDVFWVSVPQAHTVGSEQRDDRPYLVVSADSVNSSFPVVVAVPLTSRLKKANRRHRILIPASEIIQEPNAPRAVGESIALTEQVRVLSIDRLGPTRLAHLTPAAMAAVEAGLCYVLAIP